MLFILQLQEHSEQAWQHEFLAYLCLAAETHWASVFWFGYEANYFLHTYNIAGHFLPHYVAGGQLGREVKV